MTILQTTLARWLAAAVIVLVALAAAAAYLGLAEKQYEAIAKVQITPVQREDSTFVGISAFREGGDETSPAETAADLVETSGVAAAVAVRLRKDRQELLDAVEADAGSSNTVSVRARENEPRLAAQIANAFADEFVSQRAARFQADLQRATERLREQLRSIPATRRDEPPARQLAERLAVLEGYVGEPDPTVAVVSDAVAPKEHASPRPLPVLAAALGTALLLVLGSALALPAVARSRREPTPALARPGGDETAAREEALSRREAQLEERLRVVGTRERELARRAGELSLRERGLEDREGCQAAHARDQAQRDAALADRESALLERESVAAAEPVVPEPVELEVAEPVTTPTGPPSGWHGANLVTLERLVAEGARAFPDRIEEWEAYLFQLRSHADNEGNLPASFDALVEEVFGDLLER